MAEDTKPEDDGTEDTEQVFNRPEDEAGKKALATERKARRDAEQQLKELQSRLQQIEDKDKSEVERLTEQVATLTKERDGAVQRADRLEVAVLKSLDEDQSRRITSAAKRLTGSTREELEADAEEFLTAFAPSAHAEDEGRPSPSSKPREQLKPGNGDPDLPVEETDIRKLGERMFSS